MRYLAEIERKKALNVFWHLDPNNALLAADQSDARRAKGRALSLIDGLIVGVKDNIEVAGMPCTAGMKTREGMLAKTDAKVVQQLRDAGAIILGKLSLHEGALGADNDNPHYGPCHNPRRFGYTPGGSSGGSGAAIAAGLCDLALGTDTMGSVRIPASYCGVLGFKPSFARYSQRGLVPACTRLDHVGLLADDWEIIAATHSVLTPIDATHAHSQSLSEIDFPKPPRLAHIDASAGFDIDTAVQRVFAQAIARINRAYSTQMVHLDAYADGVFGKDRRAGLLVTESEMAHFYAIDLDLRPQLFSSNLLSMLQFGRSKSNTEVQRARDRIEDAAMRARAIFDQSTIDVLLTPTTPQTAFPFGQPAPANQADLTSMANFAGLPAISLPMGEIDGLPIGLQMIGRPQTDLALIRLAMQVAALLR
jgi:Asp-tRNA(Asn)/Glu-tRNA(Gln) amidotransferase A subunit family amidase